MNDSPTAQPKDGYLSAGRFAQAAQLSRKALRHYDRLGLLVPDYIDPESGYRYYSGAQLEKARLIRMLRAMDMPLPDVRLVLEANTPDEAIGVVINGRQDFERRVDLVRRASYKVLAYLRKENDKMPVDITVQTFPVQHAASIRKNITVPAFHKFIPEALAQLKSYVENKGAAISGDPVCFYYGPVNEHDDGPVEICLPIEGKTAPEGDIVVREIAAHQGAVGKATLAQSNYPTILDIWDAVITWVQEHELKMTDETVCCYEIWHADDTISVVQPFE